MQTCPGKESEVKKDEVLTTPEMFEDYKKKPRAPKTQQEKKRKIIKRMSERFRLM